MRKNRVIAMATALGMTLSLGASAASYTVQAGDVLWKIARDFGTDYVSLAVANGISDPNLIYAGQVLTWGEEETDSSESAATVYEASAMGFAGEVKVEVTIEGDQITAVEVVSHSETQGIGTNAINQLPAEIVAANGTAVETVAGATVTSEAIIAAVEDIIDFVNGEVQDGGMISGTYEVAARGFGGDVLVQVTVSETEILDVEIISHVETLNIGTRAIDTIPEAIVAEQNIAVDSSSGATVTSAAIKAAVSAVITEAGGNPADFIVSSDKVDVFGAELTNDATPSSWDMTYDIVVVGGGFAGLSASHSAIEAGAEDVVLVEQMGHLGGQSEINGGQYSAYTSSLAADLQEKFDLPVDTAEVHIADTIVGGDGLPQEELVEVFVKGSPIYFDKLLENGLHVRDMLAMPGGHTGYRMYVTENSGGIDIIEVQKDMVEDAGVEVKLNTKMVQIFQDDNGVVVGIQVATEDGLKTIKAESGVILATGGFSANVEMRSEYDPVLTAEVPTTNNKASTGEGIIMAQDLGAGVTGMEWIQSYPFANPENGVLDIYALFPFTGPSYGIVYVDVDGERYVNEGGRRDVCSSAAFETGATTTFAIANRDLLSWVPDSDIEKGIANDRVIAADTIEELVEKMNAMTYQGASINMDAATLEATIAAHNSYIDSGVDLDFGKTMTDTMVKIENGPYYAIPQWPAVHHTMGGLTITTNAEVLDVDGDIIEGLYAAGEVTGGIHGTNRLGSNAVADACAFGMVAGVYAVTGENPVMD